MDCDLREERKIRQRFFFRISDPLNWTRVPLQNRLNKSFFKGVLIKDVFIISRAKQKLQEVGVGSLGLEQRSLGLLHAGRQRELDLGVVHLLDKCSASLAGGHRLYTDDLDAVCPSTVTGSHIAVALGDSRGHGHVAVFAVHVVGSGTGVVPQPDAKVLDLQGLLLPDLLNTDDLAGGLLEFSQLTQKVPKPE